jgi:hypothetical protein
VSHKLVSKVECSCLSLLPPPLPPLLLLLPGDPRQQRTSLQGQHQKRRQGAQQLSPQQRLLNVAAAAQQQHNSSRCCRRRQLNRKLPTGASCVAGRCCAWSAVCAAQRSTACLLWRHEAGQRHVRQQQQQQRTAELHGQLPSRVVRGVIEEPCAGAICCARSNVSAGRKSTNIPGVWVLISVGVSCSGVGGCIGRQVCSVCVCVSLLV